MLICILCTDQRHPVFPHLLLWASAMNDEGHVVTVITDKQDLSTGDILFLVSCSQIIGASDRKRYRHCLVLHASDLPKGRGWSPYIWAVLRGENNLTLTLFEASDALDAGRIWFKSKIELKGHELSSEINQLVFSAELRLMTKAVALSDSVIPKEQSDYVGKYLPRRSPNDSRLDPNKTIADQFDLLRVVDNTRYPAFFDLRGHRYLLKIEKVTNDKIK